MQAEAALILDEEAERARRRAAISWLEEFKAAQKFDPFADSARITREDRDTDHGREVFRYKPSEAAKVMADFRKRVGPGPFPDSVDLTREDRDSDHGRA